MRIKKIIWKDFTKNPIFTKDDMWVQGDLNTNILELEVDSNFIGKEVQLITGKIGSIDAVVYRQVISELNTFMIENTAVKSGNFNIFLRILDGDNLLVSEALKYEVKQGVCFSRISIPQKDEDWIEHVLADLKETTEKAVVANSDLENTIIDSVEKNELLKVTIEKAEATDKKLEATIIDSIEKNIELEKTTADSAIKKEELENTIIDSVKKNLELASTIVVATEKNIELEESINDSINKKQTLDDSITYSIVKKEELDNSIQVADERVAELELVAKDKLKDINQTSDSRLEEINKVANERIEEVKVSGGSVNRLDNQTFEFWLGTTADYEKIVEKSRGVLYQHFDVDGNFAGGYYKSFPFLPLYPDKRISLCLYADSNGFRLWNVETDPMPIKTLNMAGLQKWEETDDYIIYLDKDAVMTTVENYIGGTYSLFLERKALIDGTIELLRENEIEWTSEDDSKLLLDINKAQLEKITNTPVTMEEDAIPQTFETKSLPTTYECCFRIDKKSGEIYIGEGYENNHKLTGVGKWITERNSFKIVSGTVNTYKLGYGEPQGYVNGPYPVFKVGLTGGQSFRVAFKEVSEPTIEGKKIYGLANYIANDEEYSSTISTGLPDGWYETKIDILKDLEKEHLRAPQLRNHKDGDTTGWSIDVEAYVLPWGKPIVKNVMPSGKMTFITEVNETTHTFLNKGDGVVTFGNGYFSFKGERVEQLLVYKGILTQNEKDAELDKNITLKQEEGVIVG